MIVTEQSNYPLIRFEHFSLRANQFWTFSHNFMGYDPLRGDFDVNGLQYQWNDGAFSLTLSEHNVDGFKTAYFHAMASTSEFEVSTEVLRNQTLSARLNHGNDFKVRPARLSSTLNQLGYHLIGFKFAVSGATRRSWPIGNA